jgi:hypothetical protein
MEGIDVASPRLHDHHHDEELAFYRV